MSTAKVSKPKDMKNKTTSQVKALKKPGFHRVERTLYLWIKDSGRKYWIQRVLIDGKRINHSLGPYPKTSFKEATQRARNNKEAILDRGENPFFKGDKLPTFQAVAERVHREHKNDWTAKHAQRWMQEMTLHAFPKLGKIQVDKVTAKNVLSALEPIWKTKAETARRVRRHISLVLKDSQVEFGLGENVAGKMLDSKLKAQPAVKENHKSLPYFEVAGCLADIENKIASESTKLALQFTVLTGVRGQETRFANWEEVEGDVWIIPPERMKSRREHRVPLSTQALAILERAKASRNPSGLLFPSKNKPREPMSIATMGKALNDIGYKGKVTPHGFRASFRTWASEEAPKGISWEAKELALAHAVGSHVERSYDKGELLEERRQLMQEWADYLR